MGELTLSEVESFISTRAQAWLVGQGLLTAATGEEIHRQIVARANVDSHDT